MQAIISGSYEIVNKLLVLGSDVNVLDNTGNTPLQIALLMERQDIADLLVKQTEDENKSCILFLW
jgi:ankyrin repeat protein